MDKETDGKTPWYRDPIFGVGVALVLVQTGLTALGQPSFWIALASFVVVALMACRVAGHWLSGWVLRVGQLGVLIAFGAALWQPMVKRFRDDRAQAWQCRFELHPMTARQVEKFNTLLANGDGSHVQINRYGDSDDVEDLFVQVKTAFIAKGWDVGLSGGQGTGHGLRILSADTNSPEVSKIMTVLGEIHFPYYLQWKKVPPEYVGQSLEIQIGEPLPTRP